LGELEDCFKAAEPVVIAGGKAGARTAAADPETRFKKILDPARSQRIAISFRSLPQPKELKRLLNSFTGDPAQIPLGAEQVQMLVAEMPTPDMIESMRKAEKERRGVPWDRPEQYLREIASVPHFEARLRAWGFLAGLGEATGDSAGRVEKVRQGLRAVETSPALKAFLTTALAVGNRMNAGSTRGGAEGFALESLVKFDDVKTGPPQRRSLLHYVVFCFHRDYPKLAGALQQELAAVAGAKTVCLKEAVKEAEGVLEHGTTAMQAVGSVAKRLKPEAPTRALMVEAIYPAVRRGVERAKRAIAEIGEVEESYKRCAQYFGMRPGAATCLEFFVLWDNFLTVVAGYQGLDLASW